MESIYVLENDSMPGLVKIGRTDRSTEDRVAELSAHTGVPTDFKIFRTFPVTDSLAAETIIHERLAEYRINKSREFFRISAELAASIIENEFGVVERDRKKDFDREDDLTAQAAQLAKENPELWPGMIAGHLKISHEDAARVFQILIDRKIVNPNRRSKSLRGNRDKRDLYAEQSHTPETPSQPSAYHLEMVALAKKERIQKVQKIGAELVQIINDTAERTGQSPVNLVSSLQTLTQVPVSFIDGKLNITVEQLEEIEHKMRKVRDFCTSLR